MHSKESSIEEKYTKRADDSGEIEMKPCDLCKEEYTIDVPKLKDLIEGYPYEKETKKEEIQMKANALLSRFGLQKRICPKCLKKEYNKTTHLKKEK